MLDGSENFTTLRDWLRAGVSLFTRERVAFGQGQVRALEEAAHLLAHACDLPADSLEPFLDARITPAEAERFSALLRRRVVEHRPAAYLTGTAWFAGLPFAVDDRVLIPRSYFVEIIPDRLAPWIEEPGAVSRVLELCTGSACLAILLARAYPAASVDAVDLSPGALEVARTNVAKHRLGSRIALFEGDCFAPLRVAGRGPYELIVANPPYEPSAHLETLPPEFSHEPRLALDGGADGMEVVRRILVEAPAFLAPGGLLVMEVGALRQVMEAEFPMLPFQWFRTEDGETAVLAITAEDLAPVAAAPARATRSTKATRRSSRTLPADV